MDPRAVERYIEAIKRGSTLPALVAYETAEGILLSDGFLRFTAYLICRRRRIRVEVRRGNRFDAILNAVAANADHGEPRTLDGIERAVLMLSGLRPRSTSRAIARHVQISEAQVDAIRKKHQTR
jgi:hypothetical protein